MGLASNIRYIYSKR